ncbi:MAG: MBL fold metallo-hydrolase [Thermodesulfobacteriota bacterium]
MGNGSVQITDDVFQVGGSGITGSEDAAVYLIRSDGGPSALVDAGCGGSLSRLLKNIRSCGVKPQEIEYLLLTHCHYDHIGGASALRAKTRCRTVAHELDAPYIEAGDHTVTAASWYGRSLEPFPVDIKLTGAAEEIRLGDRIIQAFHIPGHSPGSLAYLTTSGEKRVLFGQDVHGPLAPTLLSDPADYQRSLQHLLSLNADILCEGHYGVYNGQEAVQGFIESFLNRCDRN